MKQGLLIAGTLAEVSKKNKSTIHPHLLRYRNDLGFAYHVMKDIFDFDKIDTYYYKGNDFVFNKYSIHNSKATRDGIINVFNNYSNVLTKEDLFVLVVTNHGIYDKDNNETYICLYDGDWISLHEISILLSKLDCKKVLIMGQCTGGNMLQYNSDDTAIISASETSQDTYMMRFPVDNLFYDEFLYYFLSYLNGYYPNGTLIHSLKFNGYSLKPLMRAFIFAKQHIVEPSNPQICLNFNNEINT